MIKFSNDYDDNVLTCPNCDGSYLHHERVTVYSRAEDEEETVVTEINGKNVTKPSCETSNPSARRDGITIQFWCEECNSKKFLLHIAQHKGTTQLSWEK